MPRSSDKKAGVSKKKSTSKTRSKPVARQDLPDPDSIVGETSFTSPKGNTYRVIITDETDAYDEPERSQDGDDK